MLSCDRGQEYRRHSHRQPEDRIQGHCHGNLYGGQLHANFFVGVSAGGYCYDAVLWAEKGITSGTSAAAFSPNAACTRAQAVTFLWRAFGK